LYLETINRTTCQLTCAYIYSMADYLMMWLFFRWFSESSFDCWGRLTRGWFL